MILCALCVFVVAAGRASGDDLYARGRYQEAVVQFQNELSSEPDSAHLHTNLGCALYRLGRYQEAINELESALKLKVETPQAARIHYNIGNCYFSSNRVDEAIESYKTALRLNPNDRLAKYNLEIALKRNNEPPPPPSSRSQSPNSSGESDEESRNNDPRSEPSPEQRPQNRMTRDEAERILDALRQTEKGPTHRGNTQRSYFNTTIKRDW